MSLYPINVDIVVVGEVEQIANLLRDYFFRDNSNPPKEPNLIGGTYLSLNKNTITFTIVGISKEKSGFQHSYPSLFVRGYQPRSAIVISGFVDNQNAIQEIKDLSGRIIEKMVVLGIEIVSIEPSDLNIFSAMDPWAKIPDKGMDRTIVKLWHDGYTNVEISKIVHLEPRTITNRISQLRDKFGKEIVPLDEQRRKKLLKN